MYRFFLPLLASIALPTTANAESTWLVLKISGRKSAAYLEKLKWKAWLNVKSKASFGEQKIPIDLRI